MTDTEVFENTENMPLESYSFTFSEAEYEEVNKGYFQKFLVRVIVLGVAFAFIIAGIVISDMADIVGGFIAGFSLLYFVISLSGLLKVQKSWKRTKEKICSSVYDYQIFDRYLFLTITRNGERVHYIKFEYDDLTQKFDVGRFYLFAFNNQLYMVKKQEIAENSIFHTLKPKAPEKPSKSLKSLSVVLMVFSIVSGVAGMFVAMALNTSSALSWWHPVVFSIIPLASFFFGLYLKKNHNAGKANFISGLMITAFVFLIFSSFGAFESEDIAKKNQIETIESYMGVELPEPYEYDNFKYKSDGKTSEDTAMQFYSKDIDYLENIILSDEKWSDSLSSETNELVARVGVADDWDYVCVYNITTDEYNKVPRDDGIYQMAAMYWDTDYNGLYVIEYNYFQ